jgi:hypothetical protein
VLDFGGDELTGQGGKLQVFKGSLKVMKKRKVRNLYMLEG